jgi:hypothetical protein
LGATAAIGSVEELDGVAITPMRPTSFYYNLHGFVEMIKGERFMAANYGGEDKINKSVAPGVQTIVQLKNNNSIIIFY